MALAWPWLRNLLGGQWPTWIVIAVAIDAALLLLAAIWWLWWRLPERQVARLTLWETKARADVEDNFRKTVGQALGGAAVLIGAVAAYVQFTQQQQAAHDLLISNQVSKGFEQLAGDKLAMRLGGIYGLEGVMNHSPEYHQPVLEALCAFVREGTTRQQVRLTALLGALFTWTRDGTAGKANDHPATDIQAALTVIGRRADGPGAVALSGANLAGAILTQANLNDAELTRADLSGAELSGAFLRGSSLFHANLSGAHLTSAYLSHANLSNANLASATLTSAYLFSANLRGAILLDANLTGAHLTSADLSNARLINAKLNYAALDDVFLSHANLSRANLSGANLAGAALTNAILTDADLTNAKNLTQAQLDEACGKLVTLPDKSVHDLKPCPLQP